MESQLNRQLRSVTCHKLQSIIAMVLNLTTFRMANSEIDFGTFYCQAMEKRMTYSFIERAEALGEQGEL
jgi:hypothetical protein